MSEKEKYLSSIRGKVGLTSVGFTICGIPSSEEAAYAELNRMHAAPDLPDVEVLGKYSPK
jgi:hypothetical protein